MERVYGAHLCYGPPIEGGFYYDMWSDEQKVSIIYGYLERFYRLKTFKVFSAEVYKFWS